MINACSLCRCAVCALQGVVSGIAIGGVITSSLSFVSQLRANDAGGGAATPEDVAPAAFMCATPTAHT